MLYLVDCNDYESLLFTVQLEVYLFLIVYMHVAQEIRLEQASVPVRTAVIGGEDESNQVSISLRPTRQHFQFAME